MYLKRFIYICIYFFQAEILATKLWVSTHPILGGYVSLFFLTILCLGFFVRPSISVVKKNAETKKKYNLFLRSSRNVLWTSLHQHGGKQIMTEHAMMPKMYLSKLIITDYFSHIVAAVVDKDHSHH